MCGIAGAMFWSGTRSTADVEAIVAAMTRALAHRGPDGDGVWTHGDAGTAAPIVSFGHRRLAIIDLSSDGAQPMCAGASAITYNGEAYNFAELRAELGAAGESLHSKSDTEVVLRGYQRWGRDVLTKIRGMFAFAIWDASTQRLVLARDRFGIKPLYYYVAADGIVFASELRALLASGVVPRRLDRTGLWQFLGYQSVPAPRTLIEGVRLLEPGSAIDLRAGGPVTPVPSWDLLQARGREVVSEREARRRTRQLLDESVAAHLVSDVPVGLFLSGGIDSSAIAMLMAEQGHRPISFAVGSDEAGFDEREHARAVAQACGADHHEIPLTDRDLLAILPEALAAMDHPSGDGINTFAIAKVVRAAGLKVALSGLGGDELFGGYPSFSRLSGSQPWLAQWGRAPRSVRTAAARLIGALDGVSSAAGKASAVVETDGQLASVWPITRQVFSDSERRALLSEDGMRGVDQTDPCVALLAAAFARHPDADAMARISYAETRTYMHDVLLADADQMSMAHGLEIRVPFVDHHVAEFVVGLPDAQKTAPGRRPKPLLVESLTGLLPDSIVNRPKRGFTLPFPVWMKGGLRTFCEDRLGPRGLGRRTSMRSAVVEARWREFLAGSRRVSWPRLWLLVVLESWLDQHGIEA